MTEQTRDQQLSFRSVVQLTHPSTQAPLQLVGIENIVGNEAFAGNEQMPRFLQ